MNSPENTEKTIDRTLEQLATSLFSRAFSQPMKLLGQSEASLSNYAVFWCVAHEPGRTQVEIARLTGLSSKTVSRVLSLLGESGKGRGWLAQKPDAADRRLKRLYLSRKGKATYRKLMRDLAELLATSIPGLQSMPERRGG